MVLFSDGADAEVDQLVLLVEVDAVELAGGDALQAARAFGRADGDERVHLQLRGAGLGALGTVDA